MKLRIKGNSLRLRLTQGEVARLGETGRVEETIQFGFAPQQQLVYALQTSVDVPQVEAHISGNEIVVHVPAHVARHWIETEQVGIAGEQSLSRNDGGNDARMNREQPKLRLLIEKDFVCIDASDAEENADAFPNPNKSC